MKKILMATLIAVSASAVAAEVEFTAEPIPEQCGIVITKNQGEIGYGAAVDYEDTAIINTYANTANQKANLILRKVDENLEVALVGNSKSEINFMMFQADRPSNQGYENDLITVPVGEEVKIAAFIDEQKEMVAAHTGIKTKAVIEITCN